MIEFNLEAILSIIGAAFGGAWVLLVIAVFLMAKYATRK